MTMTFTELARPIFDRAIADYHLTDNVDTPIQNPYAAGTIAADLYRKSWIDTVQYFFTKYHCIVPQADATINTESPAWAIDRLSILALKIYHMHEQVQRTDASEEHRATCQKKLDVLLEQQVDLSTAIDQLLADIEAGRKWMKVYKQMKMYNDPSTNPVLYGCVSPSK